MNQSPGCGVGRNERVELGLGIDGDRAGERVDGFSVPLVGVDTCLGDGVGIEPRERQIVDECEVRQFAPEFAAGFRQLQQPDTLVLGSWLASTSMRSCSTWRGCCFPTTRPMRL